MITALALLLVLLTLSGLPVFAAMMAAAMLGLHVNQVDLSAIPLEINRLANAPVLLAIPFFTFAGYLLAEGGTPARLIRFSRNLFGWIPGGLGVVALVSCAFFTAITGATGITIVALGGLLLPALVSEKYEQSFSLGLVTSAGSLGLHFPPSLPIILYGFVSGVSIEALFIGGILPGVLLVGSLCLFSIYTGSRWKIERPPFSGSGFLSALKDAALEIPIPFLVLAGIYTGVCTATEAGALAVVYVLFVKILIFRELHLFKDVPKIMLESMKMVGGIMIVLGAALGFTNYLIDAFIPMKILEWMEGMVGSRIGLLLLMNVFLILVGCMMDIFSAILVVVPLIMPLAAKFGIDPVHLGIVFLTNLGIGYNTPPIGINLFIASSRFNRPVTEISRATLPFLLIMLIVLLVITYWPPLTLFLPGMMK
ncbi:MAG: TRAP transporter large permease [Desulfobacterales bacterium]|nr:TRAP transporter large permease [Desulfobacterales bacterium]